jgi:acetyl-CoA carboxylase biotin carboxyl carrier protein
MTVDTAMVRELAELIAETGLTEIEVADGERRIRVSRAMTAAPVAAAAAAPAAAAFAAPAAAAAPEMPAVAAGMAVKSPMVGTVYLTSEPGAPPFVRVGDTVKAGDTLLIVEAMKVMNPITAPSAGVIADILVGNGDPVEYDQPLVTLA